MADILMEIAGFVLDFFFFKSDQNNTVENIKKLKQYKWFQDLLADEKYGMYIAHNEKVRKTIGKFKTAKLDQDGYQYKCHRKLYRVLRRCDGNG